MRFGPFPYRDIERISDVLRLAEVKFEILKSEEDLARQEFEWHSDPIGHSEVRSKTFDPAFLYFEVPDDAHEIIGSALQEFGVLQTPFEPDLETVDFICPRCGYIDVAPGMCPHHGLNLLDEETYVALKNTRLKFLTRLGAAVVLTAVILLELLNLFNSFRERISFHRFGPTELAPAQLSRGND